MAQPETPETSSEQTGGAASPGPAVEPTPEVATAPPGPAPAINEAPQAAPVGLSDADLDKIAERLHAKQKPAAPAAPAPKPKPAEDVKPADKPDTAPGGQGGNGYGSAKWFDRGKKTGKSKSKDAKE